MNDPAVPVDFLEGVVQANGLSIHYYRSAPVPQPEGGLRRRSRPRAAVLLLHGVTDNGRCWVRVAQALAGDYDIYMPDARGHGFSDAPEDGYGPEDRAADTAGLIEALALDRPVIFGHSMGAETAVVTAGLYPDLVRAVILEDPPWPGRLWGGSPEERAERAVQWRDEVLANREKPPEALLVEVRQQHPGWPEEELGPWVESKGQVSPNVSAIVLAPRRRWTDYVRLARCPILLLTGDPERGAIVTVAAVEDAVRFWKDGRVVHIPGAGHCIHREQFAPVMHAVRGFLKKVA